MKFPRTSLGEVSWVRGMVGTLEKGQYLTRIVGGSFQEVARPCLHARGLSRQFSRTASQHPKASWMHGWSHCPAWRDSSSNSGSRPITVKIEGGMYRGHGCDGHNGLLSCIHPISRGDDIYADHVEAAHRVTDEAYEILDDSGLVMNPKSRKLKTLMANAAAVHVCDALSNGPRSANAQFCLGVMLWKGIGMKRFDEAFIGIL
jgi:hypothetical protein